MHQPYYQPPECMFCRKIIQKTEENEHNGRDHYHTACIMEAMNGVLFPDTKTAVRERDERMTGVHSLIQSIGDPRRCCTYCGGSGLGCCEHSGDSVAELNKRVREGAD